MSHKVSVIIPNYNHAAYLQQRIETVLYQTLEPFEIIILDDCSTDNSVEIIETYVSKHPQIKFIKNEVNSGSTFAQWNKGVSLAKGDLVWIAESDDMASSIFLQNNVSFFEKDEKIVLAYCQSNRINSSGIVTGSWKDFTDDLDSTLFCKAFIIEGKEYIERFLIHRNTIPNASAVVFSKSAYEKSGGATSNLKNVGDWLTWIQILCYGKMAYSPLLLNEFRAHDESVIAKSIKFEDKALYKDWYGLDMRILLVHFFKSKKVFIKPIIKKRNAHYMAIDKGNLGLYKLKNGEFLYGWKLILKASLFPTLQSGFIKKAFFSQKKS